MAVESYTHTYTYIYNLADAFIQSNLQCIQIIHFFYHYVCSFGIEPTTFCTVNAMLYHWATCRAYPFIYTVIDSHGCLDLDLAI